MNDMEYIDIKPDVDIQDYQGVKAESSVSNLWIFMQKKFAIKIKSTM